MKKQNPKADLIQKSTNEIYALCQTLAPDQAVLHGVHLSIVANEVCFQSLGYLYGMADAMASQNVKFQKLQNAVRKIRFLGIWDLSISRSRPGDIVISGDGLCHATFSVDKGLNNFTLTYISSYVKDKSELRLEFSGGGCGKIFPWKIGETKTYAQFLKYIKSIG